MKKLYYAHPIDLYGTPQEKRDLDLMAEMFTDYEIINPNTKWNDEAYKKYGMDHFINIIDECDALIFRGYPGGAIPAGVAKEITHAIETGKYVVELPTLVNRMLSVEDTRRYIREIGTR